MARMLVKSVEPVIVMYAKRTGDPAAIGPAAYDPWISTIMFAPQIVHEVLAPGVARAKLSLRLDKFQTGEPPLGPVQRHAWDWAQAVGIDGRIALKHAGRYIFNGFVADIDWDFSRSEQCTITCGSAAARLSDATKQVYGRFMDNKAGGFTHYSGLPCIFNAGGRPNRATGAAVQFTHDGGSSAIWWTAAAAVQYLFGRYNALEIWLANPVLPQELLDDSTPITASVEGLSLWAALAAVCDRAGYDCREEYFADPVDGMPRSRIVVVRQGAGRRVTVNHQAPNADGTYPPLDLAATNLLAASVAHNAAAAITRPVVLGAASLCEITIELGKAWHPADLSLPEGECVELESLHVEDSEYVARYCTNGSKFPEYREVGRLWDANTDGIFNVAPMNLPIPDVASLADEAENSWPVMPYRPLPCLAAQGQTPGSPSQEYVVEFSLDAGANWHMLQHGYRVLSDRLAVEITEQNLAKIVEPGEDVSPYERNFFQRLLDAPADVRMRLTCTVVSPHRQVQTPARRDSAGTFFHTSSVFDRGVLGQIRRQATSSIFYGVAHGAPWADEIDDSQKLADEAARLQAIGEGAPVEASLAIEWPDEDIQLTDVVEKIAGLEYPLAQGGGSSPSYPRVIGRTLHLAPESWQMTLLLGTERKAGIR